MQAKRCDFCHKFFDISERVSIKNASFVSDGKGKPYQIQLHTILRFESNVNTYIKDICPECLNKVFEALGLKPDETV